MTFATRLFMGAILFSLCLALSSDRAYAETISVRVASGTDDAEEHLTDFDGVANRIDLTSSDLELGAEGGGGDIQEIGIRFLDLAIPAGSIIQSASIQFTVDETDTEDTSVLIYGELNANPATFGGVAMDITSRTKTTAVVEWNNIPLWDTVGVAGPDQQTPDLASIIQEIVNLGDWAAGNPLTIIISPNPGGERTAESFSGDAGAAALLSVTFVPEPSTIILSIFGFAGLFAVAIRRRRSS